ncbi:MAG: preprotein translocase subunit SecG [Parcubacteria group bacterium RIFCSPLOWO2_01_FULL_40_65]|nr:MAG: preprotein translocase subunit SecG [Parcubacteria group bacterium RIFCSPHIGHO2_01_FULL_40_30]OHB18742.1 MAG: preprotein translocase subunit SecG [Parcubacteria group bacterium RIFCSPHIGHO2_02_FULL_40_12]OHB21831.1 MAG: preprotein translocase subunit SecG [Parcubacteria group bacterium RIFCSPLOWO2_01_FULL_40_65]OHB22818.1 MAG: preprotein translocase subunit SecG [Parcubacteria group bacterium RIFCSPLOWO2_02_FULL_40_12]OHB24458.1 MAG: preprotein translocase subunit SecG [Parcubacteria gr
MAILDIIQISVSILLIILVLLQQRGGGLSGVFGGEGSVYATRRGIEKSIFVSTVVLAVLFILISILRLFL